MLPPAPTASFDLGHGSPPSTRPIAAALSSVNHATGLNGFLPGVGAGLGWRF
jgi:hypothetical protein